MNHKPPKSRQQVIEILRETLQRLDREPDGELDAAVRAKFKRTLELRIALLETCPAQDAVQASR